MAKKHQNTGARRAALQALYAGAIAEKKAGFLISQGLFLEEGERLTDYAVQLVQGTERYQPQIDSYLEEASDNWSLERMPIVDRTILRLAVYEMVYEINVPLSVTINEAVELAKRFGGEDDSPRFVNGVLGRIAKKLEAASASQEEQAAAEQAAAEGQEAAQAAEVAEPAEGVEPVEPAEPAQEAEEAEGAKAADEVAAEPAQAEAQDAPADPVADPADADPAVSE